MAKPEKTILDDLKDAFDAAVKETATAANDAIETIEEKAADLAIKREELWERHRINDRLTGAAITAKFGLAGLKFAPVTVPLAAVYGFINGPKIVEGHDSWLAKHKKKRAGESADSAPKPPANQP